MQGTEEMQVQSLGQEDPLKKSMATHFSIFAKRIPWTEGPGRLQSTGSHRVVHNWSNLACMQGVKRNRRRREKDNEPFRNLSFRDLSEDSLHLLKSSLQLRWIVPKNGWDFICPARSLLPATSPSPGKWESTGVPQDPAMLWNGKLLLRYIKFIITC